VEPLDNDSSNPVGDDAGEAQQQVHTVPEIILSSSTLSLREKLRSMGVKLMLVERWNGMKKGEVLEENELVRSSTSSSASATAATTKKLANDNDDASSSPNVKAELVALRRAQASGETVGADVSISIKPVTNNNNWLLKSPKRIPPLRVTGIDDCSAFFEVYYNTCGQIGTRAIGSSPHLSSSPPPELGLHHDVPLLLCRKLGPFLHSSVKSLLTTKKRKFRATTHDGYGDGYASINIHDILLPCAVHDLICALVWAMKADEQASYQSDLADEEKFDDDDDHEDVGSHHLVVRAVPYGGEEAQATAVGTIGSHSSKGFNASPDFLDQLQQNNACGEGNASMQSCHYGEMLMLAVRRALAAKDPIEL
jgi:hypothetical protein